MTDGCRAFWQVRGGLPQGKGPDPGRAGRGPARDRQGCEPLRWRIIAALLAVEELATTRLLWCGFIAAAAVFLPLPRKRQGSGPGQEESK